MTTAPEVGSGSSAEELVVAFARAGHAAGYPTADLEERVRELAGAVGLPEVEISSTPTLIELSVARRTHALRVRPTTVDLDQLASLDDVSENVFEGRLSTEEARTALVDVETRRLERPWPILLGGYALAGAALTPVLGGGWREGLAGAVVGLLVGALAVPAKRRERTEPMVAPLAAVVASFGAAALAELGLAAAPNVVTLAALVTFLPGMALTIGMRELATDHLQSGVANTARALVQLLGLVVGVGVGRSIAEEWFGQAPDVLPDPTFSSVNLLAAVAAGLAFTVTLRARFRDAWAMCAATVLALSAREVGEAAFGAQAAVFVAALAVGVAGGLVGGRLHRSPLVFIVPGVLMLVPGSAGFNSALQLLANQTVTGIAAAFDTFVTAMSIAYGLMVSTLVLPRRMTGART